MLNHIAKIFIVATGTALLAGCVEDDAYYSERPHLHTQTSYGYQVGGVHSSHSAQPVVAPAPHVVTGPAASTGYQVGDEPAPVVGGGYEVE